MNKDDWSAYVTAITRVHGLALDEARHDEVVVQLQRIHALAGPMLSFPLPPEIELAPVFRPCVPTADSRHE